MVKQLIHVEIEGMAAASRRLGRIKAMGGDLGGALSAAGGAARSVIIGRFKGEHGPGGIPWPKSKRALGLAPNARGKKVPGLTLTDTGELRNSLVVQVRDEEVEVGFQALREPLKAIANQFGASGESVIAKHTRVIATGKGKRRKIIREENVRSYGRINRLPPRPMLGNDDEMLRDIDAAVGIFLLDLLKG